MQLDRSRVLAVVVAALAGVAVFALWPRQEVTPEDVIRAKVDQMVDAAERRDVSFIVEQLAEDFRSRGGGGRDQVRGILVAQLLRGQAVRVFPVDIEVTLEDDSTADFSGKFVFARQDAQDLGAAVAAGGVTAYRIDGKLRRGADGEWRFVSADHSQVPASELF